MENIFVLVRVEPWYKEVEKSFVTRLLQGKFQVWKLQVVCEINKCEKVREGEKKKNFSAYAICEILINERAALVAFPVSCDV